MNDSKPAVQLSSIVAERKASACDLRSTASKGRERIATARVVEQVCRGQNRPTVSNRETSEWRLCDIGSSKGRNCEEAALQKAAQASYQLVERALHEAAITHAAGRAIAMPIATRFTSEQ